MNELAMTTDPKHAPRERARPLATRTRRRSARRLRAYTAVEVMMAIAVLGVGAAGVISMVRGTIKSNLEARKLDLATSIARTWVERVRRDATAWTLPNSTNPTTSNVNNAPLLADHEFGIWFLPVDATPATGNADGLSPGFDLLGRDLPTGEFRNSAVFCTHLRFDCLVSNPNVANTCPLLRVQARVFWPRNLTAAPANDFCSVGEVANVEASLDAYHFVYVTSAVRQSSAP